MVWEGKQRNSSGETREDDEEREEKVELWKKGMRGICPRRSTGSSYLWTLPIPRPTCTLSCSHAHTHSYTHTHTHVQAHTHTHTHVICTYLHPHKLIYFLSSTHICTKTHRHRHTHAHTHTVAGSSGPVRWAVACLFSPGLWALGGFWSLFNVIFLLPHCPDPAKEAPEHTRTRAGAQGQEPIYLERNIS